jgi:membrane protein DedA with SNARE-associated domain/rhodanese-related sulfurtransferase
VTYYLIHTTYPILFVAVLARQLCLPLPASLFLLSGGALAGAGKLSYTGIALAAMLGCVLADLVWFEAGRVHGKRVIRLLCALAADPSYCIRNSKATFAKKGVRTLLIAKFIPGLDVICPPLAGMTGVSRLDFVCHDAVGAGLWAGAYITCGFLFAKELDKVVRYLSVFANVLIMMLGIPLLILFIWKLIRMARMIKLLAPLKITPEQLKARLDSGESIAVVDLLRFEDDPQGVAVIPGAVRLDPLQIRRKREIHMPSALDLVLYCGSKNSFASARVAAAMRKQGIQHIYVLDGGLAAWKALQFPLSVESLDPEKEMERLGIEMIPPWRNDSPSRRGGVSVN